ncbi:MAG: arginine--tRNA ligase [Capsulimonadales bacterium]|nr:arginine--tRNA ligase [Capsulimonadales bacterium]
MESMSYTYDRLRDEATQLLTATGLVTSEHITLANPKPNIPADLAFPVFAAAKAAGAGNPNEFAQRLASDIVLPENGLIGKVEPAGGFVNFAVDPARYADSVLAEVREKGDTFGNDPTVGADRNLILEYSSPNIARKMHVGHLRSTVIGHSLYLILKALGYQVTADNHLGDWGTQFGTLLAAIDQEKLTPWNDPDPVQSLVEIYSRFNNAARENPALMDDARAWFKKLEDGDVWARETWQKLIDITLVEFDRTYARLGVHFDTTHGESYFEPMLGPLIQEALEKGVARKEDGGAVSVHFDDKLPSCLLQKSDGATLYQTRDAATCIYRWNTYHPVRNIYVVGAEQKLHFQQVFEIVRRMGYTEIADASLHISFGAVTDATGARFSMRKGTAIFLNEVLDEAIERAIGTIREKVAEGKTEITEEEIPEVAEMVGIGTVIYADLYQGPERGIKFDWDKIMAWDGNTSLYIQYTHARCRSILRKAALTPPTPSFASGRGGAEERGGGEGSLLITPEEQVVLKQLARLPHAVREAGEKFLPATVAEWTYNLAREFARFYDKCPVLTAPTPELRDARLALVSATAQGLKNGLTLLGIGAPERM